MEIDIFQLQKDRLLSTLQKEITDTRVLKSMEEVPREEFVPQNQKQHSYLNAPLSIGYGQTISQPYIVALMTQMLELKEDDRVLDIGTGSGYQAAVLSRLCKEVVSIERVPQLAQIAKEKLNSLGYTNVTVVEGNGMGGYKQKAPYNKILCAAAFKQVPKAWKEQLVDKGLIVMPIERYDSQILISIKKKGDKYITKEHTFVRFVPLIED